MNNEFDLLQQMSIVQQQGINEFWSAVGLLTVFAFFILGLVWLESKCHVFKTVQSWYKRYPFQSTFVSLLVTPLIIYGATKMPLLVPREEQCDYRIGDEVDITDGWLNYAKMDGEIMPTNIPVACCGGAVTNTMEFTHTGQFYIETIQYPDLDLRENEFWVRDSETNDWTHPVVDSYMVDQSFFTTNWVSGWRGEICHMPNYEDPKAYRYWFIGPQKNLPEKIIEGGIGIEVDFYLRDAHHVYIKFHTNDPELQDKTFVLQMRYVTKGPDDIEILGDWVTLATTKTREFYVEGNYIQKYNRMRIYADKGEQE